MVSTLLAPPCKEDVLVTSREQRPGLLLTALECRVTWTQISTVENEASLYLVHQPDVYSCIGLYVGHTDISAAEPLPEPILSAWPSFVVPNKSNVTLECMSFVQDTVCDIERGDTNLDSRTPLSLTERTSKSHLITEVLHHYKFYLIELEQSDAGHYTCKCLGTDVPDVLLLYSDAILILVTGRLPKPSLQAHQACHTSREETCDSRRERDPAVSEAHNMTEYKMFLLLKEGVSAPVQAQRSERNRANFSLHDVTLEDTGKYSCVYHQIGAPFWASHPSDLLEILVSDFFPKPSLSAWPNSVASENSNVTLRCVSPTPGTQLVLRKGDSVLDSRLPHHLTEGTAEFHLTNLQPRHAGYYTCEYYRKESPNQSSPSSDVLLLLVTGYLPKPSLRVQHLGQVTAGEKVKLQCQKPHNFTEYKMFTLLKEGTSSPIQLLNSENDTVEFTLQNVTAHDAGRYSCVYLQAEAPFRASHKSEHIDISVAMSLRTLSQCYTKINLIRLGMSAMFVVLMVVFLVEAWYSQRVSPSRPSP
uniref:LOW QUALITY PROTEIN: immunoglobulin superfamily member 1-like n=1 Tax=Myodes glareolus TaxID=447135 RepID=UPI00202040CB|nr:LOW QUALITY PROTEIN: immunoglobulin superfamily member 1-like [Myodes glareolus]